MNSLQQKKPSFSAFLTSEGVKKRINEIVGSEKGQDFITQIVSAVSGNPQLSTCENSTILSAALVGQSLGLSPSSFMGQYYFVPFNDRKNNRVVCTFQIGYKGYIAMAMKSGMYKDLDVIEIREGELVGRDKETGKYQFEFIEDEEQRENAKVIGYMAYFELLNGFRKVIYWSKAKMEKHALEYSQGYKADKAKGTAYTFWSKDFNGMAFKTMLRQLISKWGIMSTTLEKAYINDMSVVKEDGSNEYVDSDADNFEYNTTPVVEEEPVKEEPKVASKRVVREETEEQDIASLFAQAGIDTK